MLHRIRQRLTDESGFTLIELLVVVLIIGILSAIAIPAFLSQTSKASDSAAKTQVGTLQTTIETWASENSGSYVNAKKESPTTTELNAIEPTLKDTSTAKVVKATGTEKGYELESESVGSKNKYKLVDNEGAITRSCTTFTTTTPANTNGGCKGGSW
jgi:type IV pilus assembly protein PilA